MTGARKLTSANHGRFNKEIYTLDGQDGSTLLMKVLSLQVSKDDALGEAEALNMVHELHTSGMIQMPSRIHRKWFPALVMERKSGISLFSSPAYKRADTKEKKRELMKFVIEKVCEEVARIAVSTGILHYDNNPDNIFFTFSGDSIVSVDLIDYCPPYTYMIDNFKNVDKAKIVELCRTSSVWTALW
ncbi:hypothetical protein J3R30DRAFT_1013974 [Lentinula aciculospora]|uniref:Protein kinase domain-containing protein n=1 Tax=Lentinula aciculospora TaxID=153920 RepID=A0A9W9A2A9_9AGAR|nr:hypothetical protein J3R30DRAFT_1013974 [Lentinula aciculospora]